MIRHLTFFLFLGWCLIGCIDTVDPDELLDVGEKTYIQSYLSPSDTVITVYVSKALPAVGTPLSFDNPESGFESFVIEDAQVVISDESENEILLPYDTETLSYRVDATEFPIREEADYFLNVSVNGRNYSASCSIPKKVSELTGTFTERPSGDGFSEVELNVAFDDLAGESNFYIVGAQVLVEQEEESFSFPLDFELDRFVSDANADGLTLGASTLYGFVDSNQEQEAVSLTLQVANVGEDLFQNLRTSYLNDFNDGNPFVEYSIAPNNIVGEDGVGVFAGYQLTEQEITYNPNDI